VGVEAGGQAVPRKHCLQEEMLAARTIDTIRRSFHHAVGCSTRPLSWPGFVVDPQEVVASFRRAHERMTAIQGSGLMIAFLGTLSLTVTRVVW
jgi:hypothetical protein